MTNPGEGLLPCRKATLREVYDWLRNLSDSQFAVAASGEHCEDVLSLIVGAMGRALDDQPLLSGDCNILSNTKDICPRHGHSHAPLLSGGDGELVQGLRTHAFDDCNGKELPTHIANVAADRILALNAENDALSSRCGMLEGENANLKSNLKSASEWLIKLVGEEPFRAALSANGEKL